MTDPMGAVDLMDEDAAGAPHERRRCTGTSKQTGERCGLAPVPGARVCRFHGGGAPQVQAAAERRQQEAAAQAFVARYGVPMAVEWHEAIQAGLDETYGNVLALRDLVQQMAPDALTWGQQSEVMVGSSQFPGVDITHAAGIAPVVQLYGQERDRLHRMAVDAGKLGLEARRQAFAEQDGQRVAEVIRAVLRELGHDLADPAVLRVVSTQLRMLGPAA